MRNLKKILALVLALVMSLSLMATASATEFKDDDQVSDTYRQAVDVLSELGVFNGDQNGDFKPTANITRAEVAAILYRIATGDTGVEGNKTYAPYNQFPDVSSEDWFAGYVTYCANAGYIKGRNTGKFDAKDNVLGYEVLAMILRAVGYDKNNEFVGSDWQLHTASIAREKGVLVNVLEDSSVQLSQPATRQVVAELLFRASLLPQVTWNAATLSYSDNGETLAKANLGLEDITGVVMANEYADLAGDTPISDNTTRLDVDGKAYTLDTGSELNDIGELRHAYVLNGTHVLGELEDLGDSTVAEAANDGGEGSRVSDVAKRAGLTLNESTTEYFVNFGEDWDFDSQWRLEYSVTFDITNETNNTGRNLFAREYIDVYRVKWENGMEDASTVGNTEEDPKNLDKDLIYELKTTGTAPNITTYHTFTKIIRAGTKITSADLKIMEGIFKAADDESTNQNGTKGITGYVYAGSNSQNSQTGNNKDLSDSMTWNQFYDEYINSGDLSYRESDNGEWLKIIDNDGDNVADYVLRTDFVMTTIDRYNTNNDTYTVEYRVDNNSVEIPVSAVSGKGHLNVGDVQVMETVAASELSVKDVIMYTLIDGVYHVSFPEKVTVTVDKVNKTALTFTCGEEVYNWSGIDERAVNYHDEAVDGFEGVNYNLYLDQFGYIRLYTEAEKGFALLLNAFYDTDERYNKTWKVEAWDAEANESVDWTLTDNYDYFVDEYSGDYVNDTLDNRGTWTRLVEFGQYRYQPYAYNPATEQWYPSLSEPKSYYGHYIPNYNNSWSQSLLSSGYTADPFWTNVAAYTGGSDGLYTLNDPEGMIANTTTYHTYEVNTASWSVGSQNMDGIVNWANATTIGNTTRIRATSNTVYYYVTRDSRNALSVEYWEGLGNSANAANTYGVDRVYAVTAEVPGITKSDSNYYELAQVIVVERYLKAGTTSLTGNFALWAPLDKDYPTATYVARSVDNSNNYDPRYIYALGPVSDGFETGKSLPVRDTVYMAGGLLNFYGIDSYGYAYVIENDYDSDGNVLTDNYYKHNISAGRIVSWDGLTNEFDLNRGRSDVDYASQVKEELSYDVKTWIVVPYAQSRTFGGYDLKLCSNSQHNDKVIYMYDASGKVAAVINVDRSIAENPGNTAIKTRLTTLWNDICDEIQYYNPAPAQAVVKFYGVGVGDGADLVDHGADGTTDPTKITVSHKTASTFTGSKVIDVTGEGFTWTVTTAPAALSTAQQIYTVIVDYANGTKETWTLTKSAAKTDALLAGETAGHADCGLELNQKGDLTIGEFIAKKAYPADENATAMYTIITDAGDNYSVEWANGAVTNWGSLNPERDLKGIASVMINVTAEDGTTGLIHRAESTDAGTIGIVNYYNEWLKYSDEVLTIPLYSGRQSESDWNGLKVIDIPGVGRANADAYRELNDGLQSGASQAEMKAIFDKYQKEAWDATAAYIKTAMETVYNELYAKKDEKHDAYVGVLIQLSMMSDILNYGTYWDATTGGGYADAQREVPTIWSTVLRYYVNAGHGAYMTGWMDTAFDAFNGPVKAAQIVNEHPDWTYNSRVDSSAVSAAKSGNTYTNIYLDRATEQDISW